jgi:hypothetical protein
MTPRAFALFAILAAVFLFAFWTRGQGTTASGFPRDPAPLPDGERRPVLVELFTSEGCSSCPPADALLIRLEQQQPVAGAEIIPLGFHVDYWDYIGWRDRFSSADYSDRQREYSSAFGNDGVYTPQMVVDGQAEFVGSDARRAAAVIAQAARSRKARIELGVQPAAGNHIRMTTRVTDFTPGSEPADLWLAVSEANLSNQATRGENSGRRLDHTAVVRDFRRLTRFDGRDAEFELKLDSAWKRENLRAVVFLQERSSRRILGAAQLGLATP